MYLSDDFINEIKYRNDLSEVVSNYVTLKRRGKNMIGLCPFHSEKTPSFTLYNENGSFYCFGCGQGGDVITFIMKIENLDYMEAVKFLVQRAGMSLPEDEHDDSLSKLRTRIYEANREAARFYYSKLYSEEGKVGLEYFRNRGLLDQTIKHFGLGFAPDSRFSLCNHLKSKGFKETEIVQANLAYKNKSGTGIVDRFYNRVMFPIIDLRGNVIAFGGRIMSDQKPKYLNTSDTLVFNKSNNLFSLNNAKDSKENSLILCEGYMDVIAINQAGFQNAVATLGTALTEEQAILMKRYTDNVIICYDADEAGQKATQRAIPLLRNAGITVKVLSIPDGKDPDEFIRKNKDKGPAAFKNLIEHSGNDLDYRLFKIRSKYDLNDTQGKLSYLQEAVKLLSTLQNSMEQDLYASKLAEECGIQKASIMEQLKKQVKKTGRDYQKSEFKKIQTKISGRDDKINPEHSKNIRATKAEENLLSFLIHNPDKLKEIDKQISEDDFITSFNKNLFIYFRNRIIENKEPLTMVSADFTQEEISRIYKISSVYTKDAFTKEALNEYIKTIKDEKSKPSSEEIQGASSSQIQDFLAKLKDKRK